MATQNPLLVESLIASGNNLSAASDQYIFAVLVSDGAKVEPAGNNANAIGITQDTGRDGEGVPIAMVGRSKLRLGATVTAGDYLVPDASGNAKRHVGDLPASARAMGSGVSGDVIGALIVHTASAT